MFTMSRVPLLTWSRVSGPDSPNSTSAGAPTGLTSHLTKYDVTGHSTSYVDLARLILPQPVRIGFVEILKLRTL